MAAPPRLWGLATTERHQQLGALVARRHALVDELRDVRRAIEAKLAEIRALERTGALAVKVAVDPAEPAENGRAEAE